MHTRFMCGTFNFGTTHFFLIGAHPRKTSSFVAPRAIPHHTCTLSRTHHLPPRTFPCAFTTQHTSDFYSLPSSLVQEQYVVFSLSYVHRGTVLCVCVLECLIRTFLPLYFHQSLLLDWYNASEIYVLFRFCVRFTHQLFPWREQRVKRPVISQGNFVFPIRPDIKLSVACSYLCSATGTRVRYHHATVPATQNKIKFCLKHVILPSPSPAPPLSFFCFSLCANLGRKGLKKLSSSVLKCA
jgi:hypothetical protein